MAEWFFRDGNKVRGPVSPKQLVKLARTDRIQLETLVSRDKHKWHKAKKIRGLFDSQNAPAATSREPPTPASTSAAAGTNPTSDVPPIRSEADSVRETVEVPQRLAGCLFGCLIWMVTCGCLLVVIAFTAAAKSGSASTGVFAWLVIVWLVITAASLPIAVLGGIRWAVVVRCGVDGSGIHRVFTFTRFLFGLPVWRMQVPLGVDTRFELISESTAFGPVTIAVIVDASQGIQRQLMQDRDQHRLLGHLHDVSTTLQIPFDDSLATSKPLPVRESRTVGARTLSFRGEPANEWVTIESRRRGSVPLMIRLDDIESVERQTGDTLVSWLLRLTLFALIVIVTGGLALFIIFFLGLHHHRQSPTLWIALKGRAGKPESLSFASDMHAAQAASFLKSGMRKRHLADGSSEFPVISEVVAQATVPGSEESQRQRAGLATSSPPILQATASTDEDDPMAAIARLKKGDESVGSRFRRRRNFGALVPLVAVLGVGLVVGIASWGAYHSVTSNRTARELLGIYQIMTERSAAPKMSEVQKDIELVVKHHGKTATLKQMRRIARSHDDVHIRAAAIYSLKPHLADAEYQTLASQSLDSEALTRLTGLSEKSRQ